VALILLSVPEGARFPSLLEQPQMVGALMVARLAMAQDRVARVGLGGVFVILGLVVVAEVVELDVAGKTQRDATEDPIPPPRWQSSFLRG
jgi:hypothetical protein